MNEIQDVSRLWKLESIINRNLEAFQECGQALLEIKEQRLYRFQFSSFEEYCKARWNFSRYTAFRLIESSQPQEQKVLQEQPPVPAIEKPNPLTDVSDQSFSSPNVISVQKNDAAKADKSDNIDAIGRVIPEEILKAWSDARYTSADLVSQLKKIRSQVNQGLSTKAFCEVTRSVLADIDNAINRVKLIAPYAVCPACSTCGPDLGCTLCKGRGWVSKLLYQTIPEELKQLLT